MHHRQWLFLIILPLLLTAACSVTPVIKQVDASKVKKTTPKKETGQAPIDQKIIAQYQNQKPTAWGEHIPGVRERLQTKERVIALTFDACGGSKGSKYDKKLIEFLRKERIPATLFINRRWIDVDPQRFLQLAHDPLFEIENHGTEHRPLSINGHSAYGIKGTKNIKALLAEVEGNDKRIQELTGRSPHFFRSGTAFYDDIAVKVVQALGDQIVNFDILGDAGATLPKNEVKRALLKAKPGSIVILHMNQPNGDTAEGLQAALPELRQKGFRFVKLEQYPLVDR
ncbi:Peptidoglycan/xylan/chitin deacetylase, PgdA/CDA1 family [Seinonella peptonophila]|uniref:Peptidoglycan/xylan/chitin deacetylase, PgdA/CDA1 family n=1 Tax=Seinonella peptonophila TaxID=112248 RepID=A0A1M4XQN3_9BACL|nr:polysaccharide deacetylase family protein [Seinonella peptonophila]SHE95542.1 Peptidoglycan/xylan/chitin deacetylase, PgdA/CDA1 family [Seinonella peptonophila]